MKEKLIGGMALPQGILFMTEERLSAGYYDEEGQLRLYTQPVSVERFRWAGWLGRAILLPFEGWRTFWRLLSDQEVRQQEQADDPLSRRGLSVYQYDFLAGLVGGAILAHLMRSWEIPPLLMPLIPPGFFLLAMGIEPSFRQMIQQMRRNHAAEHMVAHALEKTDGLPTLEEVRSQPMLHPGCGTNLAMLLLPFMLPGLFLPHGLSLLLLLPALGLFVWMNRHSEHPLARALLSFAYLGQRLTLAPPEERDLQAALKALEGLEG